MRAATRQKAEAPAPDRMCCGCHGEATLVCAWRMHKIHSETGERIYDGKTCGVKLCARCAVGGKLCPWHARRAIEQGIKV